MSGIGRRRFMVGVCGAAGVLAAGLGVAGAGASRSSAPPAGDRGENPGGPATPSTELSTFFATAMVGSALEVDSDSDGDLWVTCWSDDDNLYSVNGDGSGFADGPRHDIVVNRITGDPKSGFTGTVLAVADEVGVIWGDPAQYNRKPTGIVSVDGRLYLAIQDLRLGQEDIAFNDAPAASVSWSDDHGQTWHKTQQPMFADGVFTTIFFLDFGRDSGDAVTALGAEAARYVYAYGLDGNWRGSFTATVADPFDLYLARAPKDAVEQRNRWEFFAGLDGDEPRWSKQLNDRRAVLRDTRRQYSTLRNYREYPHNLSVLSQGGVVYVKALRRYLYTSWTEYTYEFYEAPTPWGPWKLFFTKDFGGYPWFGREPGCPGPKNGGYATTIPSKFIAADGMSMWVQSNWWVGSAGGDTAYSFNLRELTLRPFSAQSPANQPDPRDNLAYSGADVTPIEKSAHFGHCEYYNDGDFTKSENSFDQENKDLDFWGFTWSKPYLMNQVVYTTGEMFDDGGWFAAGLRVQVRQDFRWLDVSNTKIEPRYPFTASTGAFTTYTFTFASIAGDGVRIIGKPGGSAYFTSIAELEVYYR
ncbi:DUF4185 domain-containing protein [Nocardia brasiliensis]|uniref:DUF4185 domain-containing protein n=1 Tax=Nocardia brasiliensis TaxID=37326 RepID=A0A6G9XTG6_NOCBR|nr:DUF4185 domain-containing protein [Nocardia brasiliensis]QIS04198.1 DUF4185 domain-containing protein [Nocardia brasiliensis]